MVPVSKTEPAAQAVIDYVHRLDIWFPGLPSYVNRFGTFDAEFTDNKVK